MFEVCGGKKHNTNDTGLAGSRGLWLPADRAGVLCLGTCGLAPVMGVDEDIHNQVKEDGLERILEAYQDGSIQSQR